MAEVEVNVWGNELVMRIVYKVQDPGIEMVKMWVLIVVYFGRQNDLKLRPFFFFFLEREHSPM